VAEEVINVEHGDMTEGGSSGAHHSAAREESNAGVGREDTSGIKADSEPESSGYKRRSGC
jgi:hypothetical protein